MNPDRARLLVVVAVVVGLLAVLTLGLLLMGCVGDEAGADDAGIPTLEVAP